MIDGEVANPGGEAFVEPEVRPPAHRHQVPEPLMRQLVRHHVRHPLLRDERTVNLIDQQVRLSVRDEPPVLHCAGSEVRQSDHVELWKRIGNTEVIGKEVEDLHANIEGKETLIRHTRASVDSVLDSFLGRSLHVLQSSDSHGEEIRRHARSAFKPNDFAISLYNLVLHGHVAQSRQVCRHSQRHVEGSFQRRLVEARKSSSAVRRLVLRHGHVLLLPVYERLRPVEAAHVAVELPVVAQVQHNLTTRKLPLQLDGDGVLRE
mmetsp:Transcript_8508/g.28509  ORF Transcript_8508/g.28509 Transcript_8508/m.28509 type:complete len:262 (+) Transcript_8508:1759-2544(+)